MILETNGYGLQTQAISYSMFLGGYIVIFQLKNL